MTNEEYVAGLRAIADWYETNPEIPLPDARINVYGVSRDDLARIARSGGHWNKRGTADLYYLTRDFGKAVILQFIAARESVCTRRVVGTVQTPERVTPAYERPIIEWDCNDPLLAPEREEAI